VIATAAEARALFRSGTVAATSGWVPGKTQVNLIAVPAGWAYDMLLYAQRNPKPCPVLDVTDPGATGTILADDTDIRTDFPAYRVWRDGVLAEERTDVVDLWRDDMVAFLIGCSFTFEADLAAAGIPLRHNEQGRNVPMYVTTRQCRPAGRLHGPLVVSMRPIPADRVAEATALSARMPGVHGAPVHAGDPEELGIEDLDRPDFGDSVRPEPGDVPVFWACGVTPQSVVATMKPEFCITHYPGCMLVTDRKNSEFAIM